jgi:hypothetical protein
MTNVARTPSRGFNQQVTESFLLSRQFYPMSANVAYVRFLSPVREGSGVGGKG